jgi:hypothetical protein
MSGQITVETQRTWASCACTYMASHFWLLFFCGLYFGTGAAFYMSVEGWSGWEALYFLMVTASTVGYGDMNPTMGVANTDASLAGSRVFTIFYIIFGITVVFAQMSTLVGNLFQPIFNCSKRAMERAFPAETVDLDGDGDADFKIPRAPTVYYSKNLFGPVFVIVSFQLLFAAVFVAIEPGWDFGTAMYHCLVTATTVGYGDVSITTNGGRMWAFLHILISVSLLAALIGQVGELAADRTLALKKLNLFDKSMDTDLMLSLDKDGDGVDRFEFVVGMLSKLEVLDESDVELFEKLFNKMDADGSGKLTREDIDAMRGDAEANRARLAGKVAAAATSPTQAIANRVTRGTSLGVISPSARKTFSGKAPSFVASSTDHSNRQDSAVLSGHV